MLVVFLANVVPAFAPPTWTILVLFRFQADIHPVPLVILGAISAVSGRAVLGTAFKHLRGRLSEKYSRNLTAAREVLVEGGKGRAYVLLGLFLVSPLPSSQLFEAAGLMMLPLRPLMGAFMVGRLFSYSFWVAGATALRDTSIGSVMEKGFASPYAVGLEVLLIGGVIALTRIDWTQYSKRPPSEIEPSD